MSQNLFIAIEQQDHDMVVRPMVLTRLGAGITASARVELGHHISFDGMIFTVKDITHMHQPPGGDIAPGTHVFAELAGGASDGEIKKLMAHGFRDC